MKTTVADALLAFKVRLYTLLALGAALVIVVLVGLWYEPPWLLAVRWALTLLLVGGVIREALDPEYRQRMRDAKRQL